jgi:prophage antirepressor-like protein
MNDLRIFDYNIFQVRVVMRDGQPWFVASDVCNVLGLGNSREATSKLDDEEKGAEKVDTLGGAQEMTVVSEAGLYTLIIRSNMPTAKPFRKWVTSEVLPSIRKHGMYATPATVEAMLADPDTMIQTLQAFKQERALRLQAEQQLQIAAPKVEYYDELIDRNMLTNFRETAIELGVPEREFIRVLKEKGYIYKDGKGKNMPYASKNDGLFKINEVKNDRTQWAGVQTLITHKGREIFRLLFKGRR